MYAEERLKAEIVQEALLKSGEAISPKRGGSECGSQQRCHDTTCVSGCRCERNLLSISARLSDENIDIADWLVRPTHNQRSWDFGLCFLYLRNVKGFGWNHKRVYRIYRELELNLRIKARKRIVRDKPEP